MEQEQLIKILEALLFVSGRPLKAKDLAKILELNEPEVTAALNELANQRKDAGIVLLVNDGEYQLSTNSQYSTQVKNFLNAELREKLTDATVEVLAIIAYRQPISKAEIEAIRGVNSQYSVRNLLMRGLIEKISNPADARSFLYQTTTEFLMHMGLTSVKDLPEFEKLVEHIKLPQSPVIEKLETGVADAIAQPAAVTPATDVPEKVIVQPADQLIETSPIIENPPVQNTESGEITEEEKEDDDELDDEDDDE